MDTTRIDAMARLFDGGMTRRDALKWLLAGTAAMTADGVLTGEDVDARNKRRKKKNRKREKNVCKGRNWCVDRSQTCGPEGGYGKCLVDASGENLCAEILFQVPSCTECEAPNCVNCRCALAAGGGDRCNNGATGYDYICVRQV